MPHTRFIEKVKLDMETTIRGMLEQDIESLTQPDVLRVYIKGFQNAFPMKSMEDVCFGFIIGAILGRFVSLNKIIGREVTKADTTEFWRMMQKRTMEIKGKIKVALGK